MQLATKEAGPKEFHYGDVPRCKRAELLELLYVKAEHSGWEVNHSKRSVEFTAPGLSPLRVRVYRGRVFTTSEDLLGKLREWRFVTGNDSEGARSALMKLSPSLL